ncbi:zinc metallopeptidase [Motiliproteus coralliicola]|nr:zinc metallopeptidase [Motiliproteus coralliicola]
MFDLLSILLAVVVVLAAPKIWARYVFFKHNRDRQDLPDSGGELACEQLRQLHLPQVHLEPTQHRSHYDSDSKAVCLSPNCMNNHSLTALVKAAYEVGHAWQDHRKAAAGRFRAGLLHLAEQGEQIGSGALLLSPLVALLEPSIGATLLFCAVVSMLTGALVHLIIIPLEWQASFEYALPLLVRSQQIKQQDRPAVKQLLAACALSPFAYALANLLDGRHWLKVLGFRLPQLD